MSTVGAVLAGEADRSRLEALWARTSPADHGRRCVLAHYLADRQDALADEVAWDERALAEYAGVAEDDLAALGIGSSRHLAPSLHLNLGDGYLRQGRLAEARTQLAAGLAAVDELPEDGYSGHVRSGLARLAGRLEAAERGSPLGERERAE